MKSKLYDWFWKDPLKNTFAVLAGLYLMFLLPVILFVELKADALTITTLAAPIVAGLLAWVAWRFRT